MLCVILFVPLLSDFRWYLIWYPTVPSRLPSREEQWTHQRIIATIVSSNKYRTVPFAVHHDLPIKSVLWVTPFNLHHGHLGSCGDIVPSLV